MMKNIVFTLLLLSVFPAISYASSEQDHRFAMAVTSPVMETYFLEAEVSPRQASEVQAPRDGKIKEVYAWPGDIVGNGAPIAKLDDTELWAKKMRLESERSEFTGHLRRIEKLVKEELVKDDIWDRNLQKVAQIRAELAIVEEQIKTSVIRAPKRGTVIWSDLKAGKEIKGADPVVWVGDGDNMWLTAYMKEEFTKGVAENDVIAIFPDETSSPILGRVDFISFGGPKGGNFNLYINAPRVGDIGMKSKHKILIPVPSEEKVVLLPKQVLDDRGFIYHLFSLNTEPNKFIVRSSRPAIKKEQDGILFVKNVAPGAAILINPPSSIQNQDIVTATPLQENWSDTYAAIMLKSENTSSCSGANGGSCNGGGCDQAGGNEIVDPDNPEKNICLVPANVFEIPELDMGNKNAEENGGPPPFGRPELDLNNLPVTDPKPNPLKKPDV